MVKNRYRFKSGNWTLIPFVLFVLIPLSYVIYKAISEINNIEALLFEPYFLLLISIVIMGSSIFLIIFRYTIAGHDYLKTSNFSKNEIIDHLNPILEKYEFKKSVECSLLNTVFCRYSKYIDGYVGIIEREKSPYERGSGKVKIIYIDGENTEKVSEVERSIEEKFSKFS